MSTTSMRGFAYALEPVRQQRRWRLDAALAELAALTTRLIALEAERDEMHRRFDSEATHATQSWLRAADASVHGAKLEFLAGVRQRRDEIDQRIAQIRSDIGKARALCAMRQRDVDALDEHRSESIDAHRQEVRRHESAQADDDWNLRSITTRGNMK